MKKTILCLLSLILIFEGCSHKDVEIKEEEHNHKEEKIEIQFADYQIKLLDLHNSERKNKKIEELVLDQKLCEYAQKHAEKMANKNSLYHSKMSDLMKESNGSFVGENVAWGQKTEKDVVNSWMWSPMHRWNILGKSYKKVGFGLAKNKNGSIYWCAVFSNKEV